MIRISDEDVVRLKMAYKNYKTFEQVWGRQDVRTKCSLRSLILLKREYVERSIEDEAKSNLNLDNVLNVWEYKERQLKG